MSTSDAVSHKQGGEMELSVGSIGNWYLAAVQHDASQQGKAPFAKVLTFMIVDFRYAEKADIDYM